MYGAKSEDLQCQLASYVKFDDWAVKLDCQVHSEECSAAGEKSNILSVSGEDWH